MKVGLPALRAADPGGAVLRPGFHRPAALLLARPLRLPRSGPSAFNSPVTDRTGRLRAGGACGVGLGAPRQRVNAHAVVIGELPRIIEADSPSVLPRAQGRFIDADGVCHLALRLPLACAVGAKLGRDGLGLVQAGTSFAFCCVSTI